MSRFHDCSLNPSRRITRCTSIRYYRTCMKFMLQNLTISRWFQNLIVIRGCQLNVWIEGMIECWDSSTFVSCASNAVLLHLCYFVRVVGVCSFHSFTQICDFCVRAHKCLVIAMSSKMIIWMFELPNDMKQLNMHAWEAYEMGPNLRLSSPGWTTQGSYKRRTHSRHKLSETLY